MNIYLVENRNARLNLGAFYECYSAVVIAENENAARLITTPHPELRPMETPFLEWSCSPDELIVTKIGNTDSPTTGVIVVDSERN